MSSPAALREEAARLDADASSKEEAASELGRQAATLPKGVESVRRAIHSGVWEGPAAEASTEVLTSGVRRVRAIEEDLDLVVRAVADEVEDLRAEAERLRRKADFLQIELESQIRPPIGRPLL
ncbi:MAG: hypothetical protein M3O70_02695 [Actinomycetota bacterium]|nr:hypothetical protein [Actinomycetota bacterium]